MKREEVCEAIKEMMEAPLSAKNAEVLASLMYIKCHWPDENWLEHWVEKMRPKARWSWEEVKAVQKSLGDEHNTTKMWAAVNATWSDMGKVLEEIGITKPEQVMKLARAFWLEDEDAIEDKMQRYYEEIVKH